MLRKHKLKFLILSMLLVFLFPSISQAHSSQTGGRTVAEVYDSINRWNGTAGWDNTYVGWYTHDKAVSPTSSSRWATAGYYITLSPLPDYVLKGGFQATDYESDPNTPPSYYCEGLYVDVLHLFNSADIYKWAAKAGAKPANDGTITVYASPIISIKDKSGNDWVTKTTAWSLGEWVNARPWRDSSTFKSHYNKPLRIKSRTTEKKGEVRYQTLNTGDGYKAGADIASEVAIDYYWGSMETYEESGLKKIITPTSGSLKGKTFILSGVSVSCPDSPVLGTRGELSTNTDRNNLVIPGYMYDLKKSSLTESLPSASVTQVSMITGIPTRGYGFDNKSSKIHSILNGSTLQMPAGRVEITYLYSELQTDVKLNSIEYYYGEDVMKHYKEWTFTNGTTMQKGETFGNGIVLKATQSKDSYVWELTSAALYKSRQNLLLKPTTQFINKHWGNKVKYDFDLATESKRLSSIASNNAVKVENATTNLTYVGTYKIRAPQIELSYYKDAKGNLQLFSATSKGSALNGIDSYQRNIWGDNKTANHVVNQLVTADVTVDGTKVKKNMVLTKSYAYKASKTNSVQGYNGGSNCWTNSALPKGGSEIKSTRYETDVQTAYTAAKKTPKRTTTTEIGKTPLIFVYVYEGGPVMTVRSVYTKDITAEQSNSNRQFIHKAPMTGTFKIGSVTLSMGATVEYPLGTESVSVTDVMQQDGVGVKNGELLGSFTDGNLTMQLDKFFTTDDLGKISTIQKWKGGDKVMESELNKVCNVWQYSIKGKSVVFKKGVAALVKSFTPNPSHAFWSVSYADLEDGEATSNPYTSYKKTYQRFEEPKFNALNIISAESGISCPFTEHMISAAKGLEAQWTLVNVGTSKSAGDASSGAKGYENEVVNNKLSGTNSRAATNYAKERMTNLEASGNGIIWAVDPYGAATRDKLNFSTDWVTSNVKADERKTWVWGIYKADKAYSRVYVLQRDDSTYELIQDVEQVDLDVYTTKYEVSMPPYLAHDDTVLRLRDVYYDNLTSYSEDAIATEALGWKNHVEVSVGNDGSVTGNTNELRVYRKELFVAGVYEEIENEATQWDTETTDETVKFRDTDDMLPGGASWNAEALGADATASFRGMIENDSEFSSDSAYNAIQGIPTSEFLKTQAAIPKYLVDIDYLRTEYKKRYSIYCYQGVNLTSVKTDAFGNTVTVYEGRLLKENIPVERTNYNYSLQGGIVWVPEDATVQNYGLADRLNQSATMFATGTVWNNSDIGFTRGEQAAVFIRDYDDRDLRVSYGVAEGGDLGTISAEWDSSNEARTAAAEGLIEPILSTNAEVTFNNGEGATEQLLEHTDYRLVVDEPVDTRYAEDAPAETFNSKNDNEKSLGGEGTQGSTKEMQIDATKANGSRESKGAAHYTIAQKVPGSMQYEGVDLIADGNVDIVGGMAVNSVNLFTPVLVSFTLSDQEAWSQKISPGVGQTMVLDRLFTLTVDPKGTHCGLSGYEYKDYSRYYEKDRNGKAAAQVKFPFPVIRTTNGVNSYCKENVWITVNTGNTEFLLPSWAKEGDAQLIRVRANAINARTNDSKLVLCEMPANLDQENYGAFAQQLVEVVGRVYGLSIIDIGDYPMWESYFRKDSQLNGNAYYPGLSNRDGFMLGLNPKYTFPTLAGSHPSIKNAGVLKPGYVIRYQLETVGSLSGAGDYVQIIPEFYYVSKETDDNGNRTRIPVDVYYDETINGSKENLVKVGSDLDVLNKKRLSLSSGDFSIDADTLSDTARLLGYETAGAFANRESAVYTFGNIMLNQYVRVFEGKNHETSLSSGRTINLWEAGIKGLVSETVVTPSVQNWYATYYLPSSVHVTSEPEEVVSAQTAEGLTYQEDCWLKDGYLLINFKIKTINGGEYHLAYNAAAMNDEAALESGGANLESAEAQEIKVAGDCNMWSVESFVKEKTDSAGEKFVFEDGDFLILDLDSADGTTPGAAGDYGSGGTH